MTEINPRPPCDTSSPRTACDTYNGRGACPSPIPPAPDTPCDAGAWSVPMLPELNTVFNQSWEVMAATTEQLAVYTGVTGGSGTMNSSELNWQIWDWAGDVQSTESRTLSHVSTEYRGRTFIPVQNTDIVVGYICTSTDFNACNDQVAARDVYILTLEGDTGWDAPKYQLPEIIGERSVLGEQAISMYGGAWSLLTETPGDTDSREWYLINWLTGVKTDTGLRGNIAKTFLTCDYYSNTLILMTPDYSEGSNKQFSTFVIDSDGVLTNPQDPSTVEITDKDYHLETYNAMYFFNGSLIAGEYRYPRRYIEVYEQLEAYSGFFAITRCRRITIGINDWGTVELRYVPINRKIILDGQAADESPVPQWTPA